MDKNPSSASDDVTVFLDTSLDTRLAVTVSGNDTISDLKRKFEHEHQLSYGEIKIRALKVERRGGLYHLSDSMHVKAAARGVEECFLFADACVVEKIGEIEHGSHNVGSDVQLIGSGACDNRLVSGADHPFDVVSKRLLSIDDLVPFLIEGNDNNIVDQNGPVDSGREKDLEMGIKHSNDDHRKTSFSDTIYMPEPETQVDHGLCSEGFRVPTAQEHKEGTSRKEISEAKSSSSLEKTPPAAKNKLQKAKQNSEEPVHLKEKDAPVHGINEEPSGIDMVPPEDSLGNEGGDVPCDTFVENRSTTEEPCRALAPNLDNWSDSGIDGTSDTYKEAEVSGKHTEIIKDISMHCNTTAEDASQSQTASKKKRKFESTTDLEDSLNEKNVLISDSSKGTSQQVASQSLTNPKKKRKFENVTVEESSKQNTEASQPEIVSELSAGKTTSTTLDGSLTETSDMLTKSSTKKKNRKKKKALNPLQQVVDAAPSRSGYVEERSMVVSAGVNIKYSSGEDVAPISRQGLKEDNWAPIQELQESSKAPSSLDFNNSTQEKPEGHPTVVDEAPGENGTSSAERVQEKREASQTNDSEAILSESQRKTDEDNAKLIVASVLSDINEPVTPSKKKKMKKKTKDSTGAGDIRDTQCDISLAGPHEAVNGEQDIDRARNKESNLSQKSGKDVSEKATESGHIVLEADKHDGNEVETSQQVSKTPENARSAKKKSKRKHDAMAPDLQKLEVEEKSASHGDPTLSIDSRTEALSSKRKNSKLSKTTPIDQSNAKCLESGREHGVQIDTLHDNSNLVSESTKLPSQQEHISSGTSLQPNISVNHEEVSCEGEEINFHKYFVPNKSKNDVVASGELPAEEVTKSKGADQQKPKKNRKVVDSSGCSHNLQSPLKSLNNQGIGGKSEASRSSSMQPQGSISNVDVVVSQPAKTVSKNGTKAQSSDASGKINSIPKVAGKQSLANGSVANSLTKKSNEAVAVPSSKTEKSNITDRNKPVKKHQSGVTQNVVATGKALGNDDGEVLNSSKHKNSSATPVVSEYRNGGKSKVGAVSGASTTSSEYSLSSESDYSDEESNAGSCASSGKDTRRSGYSSIKGKPATRLKNDDIFLNSSVYKKARRAAAQSQQEEDSQAPEFVPDSQPAL